MSDPIGALNERVSALEDGFKLYRSRVEGIGKEFKVLLAEMNIITEWIHEKFGIELINKKSCIYKHIHDYDEVEEISRALTLLTSPRSGHLSNIPFNIPLQRPPGVHNGVSSSTPIYTPRFISSTSVSTPLMSNDCHSIGIGNSYSNNSRNTTESFILPHSSASVSPPPSTPPPYPPPPSSSSRGSLRASCDSMPPTTPTRSPSLPPSIALFHQPGLTNPNHQQNNMRISPSSGSGGIMQQGQVHSQPISMSMSTPGSPAPIQSPPLAPKSNSSTLIISKKSKPIQQQQINGPMNPAPLILVSNKQSSIPSMNSGGGSGLNTNSIPISVTVIPTQPRMIIPVQQTTPTPNYPLHPKKKNAYQNQQLQLQQQQQQQKQADIKNYFKPLIIVEQPQQQQIIPASVAAPPPTPPPQSHSTPSNYDNDEQGREQTAAALQLLTLHDQLERRQLQQQQSSQIHLGQHETIINPRNNNTNNGGIESNGRGQIQVFSVEDGEMVIDVGVEGETITSADVKSVEVSSIEKVEAAANPASRRNSNRKKAENKKNETEKSVNQGQTAKKRHSPDYSADAEDEGISSDSMPLIMATKVQKHIQEKAAKETLRGAKRQKTSVSTSSRNSKSPSVLVIDGELPSTSKSGGGSATEESCSSGKPPEKLPKRGRPKKKPEDRIRTYDPRVPMMCDECGKVLKGSGALRVHKQIHANIRPHECKECGKAFRRKHHLEFHMMIHAGDKKETCSYCGKAFLIRRDLARHERTHTGEKPYSCTLCTKSFNVKQHLTLHIRTHTGERPYQCQICEKTFTQANSLRIHKKIHARDANNAANGTPSTGKKTGSGSGKNSKSPHNNSSANASMSTSGISSASTSALETPPSADRQRAPSRANSIIGETVTLSPPQSQIHQQQNRQQILQLSRSPSPYHHPLMRQYESSSIGGHDHPPSVGEIVTVVTSPMPAHQQGQGQISPSNSYHPQYHHVNTSGSFMTSCRLTLNPGSGTTLLYSRSPTPPNNSSSPMPAHSNSNPANLSTVIRPPPHSSGGGRTSGNTTLMTTFIPSPQSHSNLESSGGGGRGSPSPHHSNHSPNYYDHNNVTRHYQ